MAREVEKWVTVNGRHIPIYADDNVSSKSKLMQIARNQEEAKRRNEEARRVVAQRRRLDRYNNPKYKLLDSSGMKNEDGIDDKMVADAIESIIYGPESDSVGKLVKSSLTYLAKTSGKKFTQGDVNYITNELAHYVSHMTDSDYFKVSPYDFSEFILKDKNAMKKIFEPYMEK